MNADSAITAPAGIQADPAARADTHMNRLHHRSHRGVRGSNPSAPPKTAGNRPVDLSSALPRRSFVGGSLAGQSVT